jgi:sulfur relay (sulfurtransferase) complex TusBCD TusD component (DsrE family)
MCRLGCSRETPAVSFDVRRSAVDRRTLRAAGLDRMIASCAQHGADIGCCSTCLDARGITDDMLTDDTRRSTLEELANWTLWADQVVTF